MRNNESGYTMVELLLAVLVGSVVLAGAYSSYVVIATQYQRNSSITEIRDFAIPTISILTRNLRMTGFKAVDGDIESAYGKIDPPILITDIANTCCDSLQISYDKDIDERVRITYFTLARTNPARTALYMDVDEWDGMAWISSIDNAIVADYVEDFQVVGSDNNASGYPTLVSFNIVFRSRDKTASQNIFTKSAYSSGNNNFGITDYYLREEFETSVRLRNLVD